MKSNSQSKQQELPTGDCDSHLSVLGPQAWEESVYLLSLRLLWGGCHKPRNPRQGALHNLLQQDACMLSLCSELSCQEKRDCHPYLTARSRLGTHWALTRLRCQPRKATSQEDHRASRRSSWSVAPGRSPPVRDGLMRPRRPQGSHTKRPHPPRVLAPLRHAQWVL